MVGFWSDDGAEGLETTSADNLCFACRADTLDVREVFRLTSKLLEQDSIFLQQIFDDGLLLPIHPACNHEKEELGWAFMVDTKPAKSRGLKLQSHFGRIIWHHKVSGPRNQTKILGVCVGQESRAAAKRHQFNREVRPW